MKRSAIIFGMGLLLLACTRIEEAPTPAPEYQTKELIITAYGGDDDINTKTARQANTDVYWSPGDAISLFFRSGENGGSRFVAQNTEEVAITQFKGTIDVISGGGEDTGGEFWFWGIYPYSTENSCDGSSITTVIPAKQTGKAGTFADNTFITMARAKGLELGFYNICSGIKFTLTRNDIKEVRIRGNNNEDIAGKIKAEWDANGKPAIKEYVDGAKEVSVTAPGGGTFATGTDYYLVFAPELFTQGFTLTLITSDYQRGDFVYGSERQFKRGIFVTVPDLDTRVSSWANMAAILEQFLPDNIGKESITGIEFHVKDATVTEHQLTASVPVYYEKIGSTVKLYTSAELYDISHVTGYMFNGYSALQTLDLSQTVVPNAESFFRMFMECISLESIIFGDWDTDNVQTMDWMFCRCEKLRSLDLSFMETKNVQSMFASFSGCKSLSSLNLTSFNTSNVTDMNSMFAICQSLSSLDLHSFNTVNVTNMRSMFDVCRSLESLDLLGFDTSNVTDMSQMFNQCQNLKHLNISSFNTANVENFDLMFYGCSAIESLDLSHFITSKAQEMRFMFGHCTSLKNLDISSFTSESLQTAELMFGTCLKLQKLNMGAFDISGANCQLIGEAIMRNSKSGAIRCIPETKAVLEPTMDDILSGKVEWLSLSDDISTYEYQRNPNLYYSSDFSKHETVRKLYSATKGKGIDIVLMGDVYSDRMIASGQYDEDMELAADAIFAKEPMASFKDCFNVYIVYLVSDNEVIGESTALNTVGSGGGVLSGYASANVPEKYRILATGNGDLTVQDAIVIVNGTDHVSGYTNMAAWDFDVNYYDCDYGRGYSAIVVGRGNHNDSEEFQITVAHEFGHSFAKLADEYVTDDSEPGEGPTSEIITTFSRFGWYKNVDVTSDPATIRWSRFLSDDRYANENLGAYEGGFTYSTGVWRPSENSIMRHGTEFNAPSRAAIYNRIHKLAYGKDWQFDYETFVQQDLKNIPQALAPAPAKSSPSSVRTSRKHFFKMEKSISAGGKEIITIIQD